MLGSNWSSNGIKAKIALPTNEHLPKVSLTLPPSQLNWRTSPADFARFANASVATLVLPRVFSASGDNEFAETPPPRLFEAALAGTVQLVQRKIEEASVYFEPGKEFIYFDDADGLIESIKSLRADPDLRNSIAAAAQKKALLNHCYEHRAAYVLSELYLIDKKSSAEIAQENIKPCLLFVVHNVVANGNFGGVEVYLQNISKVLQEQYEILFYSPCLRRVPDTILTNVAGEVVERYNFSEALSPWQISCPERDKAFISILEQYNVSTVHFHHLIGHSPSLVKACKALGVPSVMTFHDYYAVCHRFTLLSFKGSYCEPDKISHAQCDVCLWSTHQIVPGSQSTRRAAWDQLIASTDSLIFNTNGSHELTAKIYPAVASHKDIKVIPVPTAPTREITTTFSQQKSTLRVAILGNFSRHKGGDVISRVIPLFENSPIEFHIFGRVDGDYFGLNDHKAYPQVFIHGEFVPGEIPETVYTCNVSLHVSIWPETYCLTLSEAWDCGLVPIVSDIGALGERVTDGVNGFKIAANSEGQLFSVLHRILDAPEILHSMRKSENTFPISRPEQHITDLEALYKSLENLNLHTSSQSRQVEPFNIAHLSRPVAVNWAISETNSAPGRLSLFRRVRHKAVGLSVHFLDYWKRHGFKSAVRVSIRYIARRL
nr:glycosyltransferase [Pseudomonas sp. PB120]